MSRFIFFFSSRRRHTRSTRDWSSYVCSSDLAKFHEPLVDGAGLVGSFCGCQQQEQPVKSVAYAAPMRMVRGEIDGQLFEKVQRLAASHFGFGASADLAEKSDQGEVAIG